MTVTGVVTSFPIPTVGDGPTDIAAGGDGNLWFSEADGDKIGRITPTGTITEFPVPTASGYPTAITAGPDGNLWCVESMSDKVGRITPTGTFAEFPIPTPKCGADDITVGPDGALWFSEPYVQKLGRITTAGAITELQLPAPGASVLATGPDGALWYASNNEPTVIGQVTQGGSGGGVISTQDAAAGGQTGLGGNASAGGAPGSGGMAGAVGPCDIYLADETPCVAAYSTVRALYGAYPGPLYQVRRASDGSTTDIPVDAPGGFVRISVQDSFCAGTTCTISILYDQSPKVNDLKRSPDTLSFKNFNEASATGAKVTVAGHEAYGIYVNNPTANVGYRNNNARGLATGDQPEAMYMVLDGKRYSTGCCFDFGNYVEKSPGGR